MAPALLVTRASAAASAPSAPPGGPDAAGRYRPFVRIAGRAAAAVTALVTLAGPATAHVTVNPGKADQGGFAKLAFRVPNERPDSGTVKLEVTFPPEYPLSSVSVRPQPGWAFTTETSRLEALEREGREPVTEAVSKITWTGGPVNPGEFQEFEVSVGPLPEDADQLVFKAVQTYASGEVVRWIDEAAPGGEEPEHPAPVLALTGGDGGDDEAAAARAATARTTSSDKDVDDAERLATVALGVGVLALLGAGVGLIRRRSPS